jgi:hypothetical protein
MGGVYNHVNLHVYHYAGNNPVKYTDPDGEITRDQHYARFKYQEQEEKNNPTVNDALENLYNQLGISRGEDYAERQDRYHEMGEKHDGTKKGNGNDKYVKQAEEGIPIASYELVYDKDGNLVTDSVNRGTPNYADSEKNPIKHFFLDVLPYWIWGNSPDDPTKWYERILGTYRGPIPTNEPMQKPNLGSE